MPADGADVPAKRPGSSQGLMTLLGKALSRDAVFYAIGMAAVFPLGIATAGLVTAFLPPAQYGYLGLLMLFSGLATVVYGLGVIQGTLMWAYRMAGDDGDEGGIPEDIGPDDAPVVMAREERRRILGSGMALSTLVAVAGTVVLLLSAGELSELITESYDLRHGVMLAAVSAGLGSVWRLALQVYRIERRAAMFLVISVSRPLFALALTAWFLFEGYGLEGAVAGTALGTAISLVLSVGASHSYYAIGFRPSDFAEIYRRGRRLIPVVIALWVVGNADLWLVSRAAPGREVGLYRLASRFGIFPSYVTSAFLMAWLPMQRSALFKANVRERSRSAVGSTMFTYFCIASVGLLLLLTVASEILISIAPPSYSGAAPLVPAVAAFFAAQGLVYALYRLGRFRYRRWIYVLMITLSAVVLGVLGSQLAGPLGGFGVALAGTIGSLMAAAGMVIAIYRGPEPLPFQWKRIFFAALIAALFIGAVVASPAAGAVRILQDSVVLLLFPVVLVVARVIPRSSVRSLVGVARALLPRRVTSGGLVRRARALPPDQRLALERWVRTGPAAQPMLADSTDERSLAELTRGLRQLTGQAASSFEGDAAIGAYLTQRGSHVDRDIVAEQLVAKGVDPLELHVLDDAFQSLRRTRRALLRRARGTVNH